jgi:hypothetical protein
MPPALQGRAQKAASQKGSRFRHLSGRLHADVLQPCWRASRQAAAAGVAQGRAQADAQHLAEPLHHLVARRTPTRSRANLGSRQ